MQPTLLYPSCLPRPGLTRALTAILVLAVLSGCGGLQFAYSFADEMVEGRADAYLDLDDAQEERLEEQTAALIAWHRQKMLPKYAAFFRTAADIAEAGGWTRPQLSAAFKTFRRLIDETVEGASPFIATVLMDHRTDEKIAFLEARLTENLAERRAKEKARTPGESDDDRVERRIKNLSRFLGDLSDGQVAIVRRHTKDVMNNTLRWLDNRGRRQDAFIALLGARPAHDEIASFVHQILVRAPSVVDPEYQAVSDRWWATLESMYFGVLKTLSDEQRDTLVFRLRGYADDMISLAGASGRGEPNIRSVGYP